jgi:catechol 2,3-dioxygenase-like lactoylglutathione lyase family enzyme
MILAHSFHRGAGGVRREWIMKRVILLWVAISLCFIAFALRAEEQPLATRVEHFFVVSDQAQSLFTFFKDTFQLPEVWPFFEHGPFSSGGLSLGNAVLEFVSFPKKDNKPLKTAFKGIAFEPTTGADATAAELVRRNIPYLPARTNKSQVSGVQVHVEWSNVNLSDFPPTNANVFFCDYKDRQAVAQGRRTASHELALRAGGPLGIVGVAEITVGVRDLEDARNKWSALLEPSPRISDDEFVFFAGPRIHLVQAESPGIQGIVLKVRSVDRAANFLGEHRLLAKDATGQVTISPSAIDGLSIRLVDAVQGQEPANPLLGRGLGVDSAGIIVRDLEKTVSDYEQALGFKCFRLPPFPHGVVCSMIFFENNSYLELLSAPRPPSGGKLSNHAKDYADFAERHEGAMFLCLATSSATAAAVYLKAHNFAATISAEKGTTLEGETKPPPPLALDVNTVAEPSGNKQVFTLPITLVEYVSQWLEDLREDGLMVHPNTAQRLHAVWFAVRDLDAHLRNLQQAGFEPGETREAKFLGASGREIKAGGGSMLLLRSADKSSLLNKFLSNHDDGDIFGISIEVSDLNKARSRVEAHSGHKLEPYDGYYGRSIMIPPDLTHGIWLELFQR